MMDETIADIENLYDFSHASQFNYSMMVMEKPSKEEDELGHCPEYLKDMFQKAFVHLL